MASSRRSLSIRVAFGTSLYDCLTIEITWLVSSRTIALYSLGRKDSGLSISMRCVWPLSTAMARSVTGKQNCSRFTDIGLRIDEGDSSLFLYPEISGFKEEFE